MKRRNRARAWWVRIHLWLGLSLGAVFALLGVTGSVLVLHDELDALLNPDLLYSDAAPRAIEPDAVVAAVEETLPDGEHVAWISWPDGRTGVFRTWSGPPDDPFARLVTVDPATGVVLGQRTDSSVIGFVYDLHYQLQLGRGGQTVVGIVGVLMLVSLGSGLYLWWPRRRHWRTGLTVRRHARAQRRDYDLHRVIGIYGILVLVVIVGTGLFRALPDYTEPLVAAFGPITPRQGEFASAGSPEGEPLTVQQAVTVARRTLVNAEVTGVGLPGDDGATYRVAMRQPVHPRSSTGRAYVWVDRRTGVVRATRIWADMTPADRFLDWQLPLHNGEAFGWIGRGLVFIAGWLPLALFVTGFLIWRHKRRAARRRRGTRLDRRQERAGP